MSEFTLFPVSLSCLLLTEAAKDRCLKQVFLCTSVVSHHCRGIRHVRATLAVGPLAPLRRLQWSTRTIMAVQQLSDSIGRSIVKGPRWHPAGANQPCSPCLLGAKRQWLALRTQNQDCELRRGMHGLR